MARGFESVLAQDLPDDAGVVRGRVVASGVPIALVVQPSTIQHRHRLEEVLVPLELLYAPARPHIYIRELMEV